MPRKRNDKIAFKFSTKCFWNVDNSLYMSFLARILVWVSTLALLHAALSTYEHLSQLKARNQSDSLPLSITIECFAALVAFVIGTSLNAAPLKEITWSSEMSKRSIDEVDARMGFASMGHRGVRILGRQSEK